MIDEVIKKYDPDRKVITDEVKEKVKAISATYPDFKFVTLPQEAMDDLTYTEVVTEGGQEVTKVYESKKDTAKMGLNILQPNLKMDSHDLISLSMSLGDIMYMGKQKYEGYKRRSNGEYLETRPLHIHFLKKFKEFEALEKEGKQPDSKEDLELFNNKPLIIELKSEIAGDMYDWVNSQIGVLRFQRYNFKNILDNHALVKENDAFRQRLEKRYSHFTENICKSEDRYNKAKELFDEQGKPKNVDEALNYMSSDFGIDTFIAHQEQLEQEEAEAEQGA